ncbi:MAG: hypothetical protein Q8K63_04935 [Acidimicrobiales bacterium]|nr:hypothetical protein [Acidimicrobiales bacterium]
MFEPLVRFELRTPLAKWLPWATMTFTGRRTGAAMLVTVFWYETPDGPVVFSPNRWRYNFTEPRAVIVTRAGQTRHFDAHLHRDPAEVVGVMNELRSRGVRAPGGLWTPRSRAITVDDLVAVPTELLRFVPNPES